ncbi:MFS transporter [Mitsuokella sp. WILCCON 0060]|uniref:MFS transporter n=1 Tax=unclassified Mitsuokella TaxID=2637239 RepID=UPI003F0BCB26
MQTNKNLLIFILMTGVFGILNTEMGFIGLLPYIAERYDVTIVHAGLLISLFALGVAIAGPIMPLLFSRFNRKHVMLFVLGLFTVCNTISVFAADFNLLLAARVLPAFFHPVYCSMAFTVAAALAGAKDAPKAVAKINIGVSAGMVVGVPISNFLAANISLSASMSFFAMTTFLVMLATVFFVPSMPAEKRLSYGKQLAVLKKPVVWASIFAVIFLNGSVFGVFNYWAAYLGSVSGLAPNLISLLLFGYGLCNIFGSMAAGNLLSNRSETTVKVFPFLLGALYLLMLTSGSSWPMVAVLTLFWGILAGINGNINQFWLSHAAPEAPDFANGLFLTSANLGTMAATEVSGIFIDHFGIEYVICGGLLFIVIAGILFWSQCTRRSMNPAELSVEQGA